jgi:hypothetical protein
MHAFASLASSNTPILELAIKHPLKSLFQGQLSTPPPSGTYLSGQQTLMNLNLTKPHLTILRSTRQTANSASYDPFWAMRLSGSGSVLEEQLKDLASLSSQTYLMLTMLLLQKEMPLVEGDLDLSDLYFSQA